MTIDAINTGYKNFESDVATIRKLSEPKLSLETPVKNSSQPFLSELESFTKKLEAERTPQDSPDLRFKNDPWTSSELFFELNSKANCNL